MLCFEHAQHGCAASNQVAQNCRSKGSPEVDVIPADLADTKNADALANKYVVCICSDFAVVL